MKNLIIILFIFTSISAMAQFHVRVQCFYNSGNQYDGDKFQSYSVEFTGDNWKTKNTLNETWDASDEIMGNDVIYQQKIFTSMNTAKQEAIAYARNFNSLQKCIDHNKQALDKYHRLLAYRKLHPIKIPVRKLVKSTCCKPTSIY